MSTFRQTIGILSCVVILLSAPAARADWLTNGVPVCAATGDQSWPCIVGDLSGGAIMAWQDYRAGGGTISDIYAQRVDASGVPQWTLNGVALCATTLNDFLPVIVSDGVGGAIVAWYDAMPDIYAQRIDGSGNVLWTSNGVPVCTANLDQMYPAIAPDGAGGAYITWHDTRNGNQDVYAQRLDASGTPMWTPNGIPVCAAAGIQRDPMIVASATLGAVIAWQDLRDGNYDIYAQRINPAGAVQWGANGIAICDEDGGQYEPRMAPLGNGVIIVWTDERAGSSSEVYAQHIGTSGMIHWAPNGMPVTSGSDWCSWAVVTQIAADRAIIAWADDRDYFDNIYSQLIDEDGALYWAEAGAPVCEADHQQSYPQIAKGGIGGGIIVWEDERNSTYDQFAQRVDGSGEVRWTLDGVSVCTYASAQIHADVASDELGGAIVVWEDDRPLGHRDVYAQRVFYSGDVATGITPVPQPSLALRPACPNPFNPATTISYVLPRDGWAKVAVYDVNGRLIRTLVDRRESGGEQAVPWDGRDDRGAGVSTGVYFVRLESGGETRSVKTVFLK
jgi:hypothetical protein